MEYCCLDEHTYKYYRKHVLNLQSSCQADIQTLKLFTSKCFLKKSITQQETVAVRRNKYLKKIQVYLAFCKSNQIKVISNKERLIPAVHILGLFRTPKTCERVEFSKGFHKYLTKFVRWNLGLVKACGKSPFDYKRARFLVNMVISAPDRFVQRVRGSKSFRNF